MVDQQQKLILSPYMEIYELVIPRDNLLQQIKEFVDFGFIYDELIEKYCLDNGRVKRFGKCHKLLSNEVLAYHIFSLL